MDAIALTHTYPYEEINDFLRAHPDSRRAVEETVAYFDGINFADKITCPIIVNIGLQDNVCPPETGYAVQSDPCYGQAVIHLRWPWPRCRAIQHNAIVERFFAQHLLSER